MGISARLTLTSQSDMLAQAREELKGFISESEFPSSETMKIILAVDEALANIVEHAEMEDGSAVEIILEVTADPQTFQVSIKDNAKPYNPMEVQKVDLPSHFAAGKKSGLGVHIMRTVMDEIDYSYTAACENCLTMIRRVP